MDAFDEPVHIVDYRAQWATQAAVEAVRIAKALGIALPGRSLGKLRSAGLDFYVEAQPPEGYKSPGTAYSR